MHWVLCTKGEHKLRKTPKNASFFSLFFNFYRRGFERSSSQNFHPTNEKYLGRETPTLKVQGTWHLFFLRLPWSSSRICPWNFWVNFCQWEKRTDINVIWLGRHLGGDLSHEKMTPQLSLKIWTISKFLFFLDFDKFCLFSWKMSNSEMCLQNIFEIKLKLNTF